MINRIIAAAAALTVAFGAVAAPREVSNPEVVISGDSLRVGFTVVPSAFKTGRDREIILTPVLRSEVTSDSIVLPRVVIAGRNRYYSRLRNDRDRDGALLCRSGARESAAYSACVAYAPWMERSRLTLDRAEANCCFTAETVAEEPFAEIDMSPRKFVPRWHYVELTGDSAVELSAQGSAFIDYPRNRMEIRPDYRRNAAELEKIISSIDRVRNDDDVVITAISIKGFASPEGPYDNNARLAMGRTEALKEYVRGHYDFDSKLMLTSYEAEDWDGLRRAVVDSKLPERESIIAIIDSDLAPDDRNSAIERRFPSAYRFLLDSVYPSLRHSDYVVHYRVRSYATIEELKKAFESTPERLRPVDFQRLASLYSPETEEYAAIMIKAAGIHPGDPAANLNAAMACLRRGDLAAADSYLAHAGNSADAICGRAAAAVIAGDLDRAERHYEEAADSGSAVAAADLERLRSDRRRQAVTIIQDVVESK